MSDSTIDTAASTQAPAIPRREITLRVIVLGLLLAVIMGAANVYVGLRAGMTVSASIPAAVMAMLLFRRQSFRFRCRPVLQRASHWRQASSLPCPP